MAAGFQVAPSISLCSLAQGQRIIPGVRSLGLIIFEQIGMQRANTLAVKSHHSCTQSLSSTDFIEDNFPDACIV